MEAVAHKKGFNLTRSHSEAIARITRRGFNLSSSSSNAVGQPCKGFSLVEAAIVLAVVGGVIGAIWVAASSVSENQKVSNAVRGIMQICTKSQTLFPTWSAPATGTASNDYRQDVTAAAYGANIFPSDWQYQNSPKYLKNCCNIQYIALSPIGYVSLQQHSQDYTGGTPSQILINIQNISQSKCIKTVRSIAGMLSSTSTAQGHGAVGNDGNAIIGRIIVRGCSDFDPNTGFSGSCTVNDYGILKSVSTANCLDHSVIQISCKPF
jgi:type II secretory pathway pseudopilin PulG